MLWLEAPIVDLDPQYPYSDDEIKALPRVSLPPVRARIVGSQIDDLLLPAEAVDKWQIEAYSHHFTFKKLGLSVPRIKRVDTGNSDNSQVIELK